MNVETKIFTCISCKFKTRKFLGLIHHYKYVHSPDPTFKVACGIDGCSFSYKAVRCLCRHIRSHHALFYQCHLNRLKDKFDSEITTGAQNEGFDDTEEMLPSDGSDVRSECISPKLNINWTLEIVLRLLSLREDHRLPSIAVKEFTNHLQDLMALQQAEIITKVMGVLKDNEIDPKTLTDIMSTTSNAEASCHALRSVRKFDAYVKNNLNFIQPQEFIIGYDESGMATSSQYIPILATLKDLLQYEDVYNEVINGHKSKDHVLRDLCDGRMIADNPLFGTDPTALQLILYYDEFTVVNPLGSKVRKNKVGAFYMTLGNLPPKYRTQLRHINLVLLFKSFVLKRYSFHEILKPLLFDLKILENEGILVSRSDGTHWFRGSVAVVIGDNLGSHAIGGFIESFNSFRVCRFCMITKSQLHSNPMTLASSRTETGHNEQVNIVSEDQSLATIYGVKSNSVFNTLNNFHVTSGLPSDVAHDLFEGVFCDVLQCVINYCVKQGFFTAQYLNQRVAHFPYLGSDKVSKPSALNVSPGGCVTVKQEAAQMWCLLRLLPLLVGHRVPVSDSKWEVLLRLLDAVHYICAPSIYRHEVPIMAECITDFIDKFQLEFPDQAMKPKLHHMTHYPQQTLKFGPLIHCWTLRFEGKHSYFKAINRITKNKVNICKTLAFRHQMHQVTRGPFTSYLDANKVEHQESYSLNVSDMPSEVREVIHTVHEVEHILATKSLTYRGITYSSGLSVILGQIGDLLSFGYIKQILLINGQPFLHCVLMHTIDYCAHFHSFNVKKFCRETVVDINLLPDPHPSSAYLISDDLFFVTVRYHVIL